MINQCLSNHNSLSSGLYAWFELQPLTPLQAISRRLDTYILPGLFIVLALAGVTIWVRRECRSQRIRAEFALFKPAEKLCPDDLNFQSLSPGEQPDLQQRPFYQTYLPRKAVPHDLVFTQDPHPIYNEEALVQSLKDGIGFVLLGQPLDGKSRTVYEIIRRLDGYEVVRPFKQKAIADLGDTLSRMKGRRVILLLEDLNEYVDCSVDLLELRARLGQNAVVAATCRDGSELGAVQKAMGTGLHRFYEGIPLKLNLIPLMPEDKDHLARSIGQAWDAQHGHLFPTPGSITMAESLAAMRERFENLQPEQRDTLRALKLLAAAGVPSFTRRRLQSVLEVVFERYNLHFSDLIDDLTKQAFLRYPMRQEIIYPEPAYLTQVVAYAEGKNLRDDFPVLEDVLARLADAEGLFYMGTAMLLLNDGRQANTCFEQALGLQPHDALIWINKGAALDNLGHYQEAVDAYEQALRLQPDEPIIWTNKGATLDHLGRYQEAVDALNQALRLEPDDADIWTNKGVALDHLERYKEALEIFDQVLRLQPEASEAWSSKATTLDHMGHYHEAIDAFDEALRLHTNNPKTWTDKGIVFSHMGRYKEALGAFEDALRFQPDYLPGWLNKAEALDELGRDDESFRAYDQALHLQPDSAEAWRKKGSSLAVMPVTWRHLTLSNKPCAYSRITRRPGAEKGQHFFS